MDRIKDFFISYKLTDFFLGMSLFVNVYMIIFMGIPSGQWEQVLWYNILFAIPLSLIAFCYEHASVSYDPDTSDFKTWRSIAKILVILYIVAIVAFFGLPVTSLYK